jgi:hypothetical protein
MSKTETKSWRDQIKVHPAADLFPMMSPDELKTLGEDIKANGLAHQIVLWTPDSNYVSIRHRPQGCHLSPSLRLSSVGSSLQISRIRLSDKTSRLHPRHVVPKPAQTYEPEVPVQVREWIGSALTPSDFMLGAQPPAQPHSCVVVERTVRSALPLATPVNIPENGEDGRIGETRRITLPVV